MRRDGLHGRALLNRAERQKNKMNQGHSMRALDFKVAAVMKDKGTDPEGASEFDRGSDGEQAVAPYLAVAPTTELVSWIASADQRPNCSWVV